MKLLFCAAACSAAAFLSLAAQATTLTQDSPDTEASAASGLSHDAPAYAIGDRLKISFFEAVGSSAGGPTLRSLIERSELSGEYVVQADGTVFLPLVGALTVIGQSTAQIEEAVTAQYGSNWNGGQIRVSIQIVEREPIYVSGPVPKPGIFKFVPGMTVIHALTLAGGDNPAASGDQWKLLDAARERERLDKSNERLKRMQAKTEVLEAERDGRSPANPNPLIALAGTNGASAIVTAESRVRILERERRTIQLLELEKTAIQTKAELVILRDKLQNLEAGVREKAERLQEIVALRTRGTTTDVTFHMARTELTEARTRWHEARLAVSQSERKLDNTAQEKARLNIEAMIEREKELKDLRQAMAEEEITRATIGHLLTTSAYAVSAAATPAGMMSYFILRRSQNGLRRLPAETVTELEPGDVVLVAASRSEMVATRPTTRGDPQPNASQ